MIEIDVRSLAPGALAIPLDESAARAVLRDIADCARAKWISLAHEHLLKTEQDYVRGIQAVEMSSSADSVVASITLLGAWPNMLEDGFGPYDMRDTLLGPNVPVVPVGERGKHKSKDGGYYRTIAFRMMGPSSSGRNAQKVTDVYATQLGKDRAAQLGKLAWKAMGKLAPSKSNPSQATNYGGRLSTAGTALDVTGRSHALITGADGAKTLVRQGGAQHAAPLFEGAMRNQQTYARATQAFTGTMRTISTSQPNGWIHPGYAGAHLLPEVENYIRRVAPSMVELVMQRMGQPNV